MKIIKYIIATLLISFTFSSCEKQHFYYEGPDLIEFIPTRGSGSMQYYNTRYYYHNYNIAPPTGTLTLNVQLIGPHRDTPVNCNYEIREFVYYDIQNNFIQATQPAGEEGVNWKKVYSTAEKGVHYNGESGSFTIPANSSFGSFDIEVLSNKDNTNTINSKMVFIVLTDSKDIRANVPSGTYMLCFGKRNSANPTIL